LKRVRGRGRERKSKRGNCCIFAQIEREKRRGDDKTERS